MITGTVLSTMEFRVFFSGHVTMLPSLNFKNAMVYISTFSYVTDLAVDTEGLSSHVTMRSVTISSTSHADPYTLTVDVEKP